MVGAVGEMAYVKRRKLWKTGEDGLCCSISAIQTRLGPSSLLKERSGVPIVFVVRSYNFFCVVGYPPNWGKWPRYIDRDRGFGGLFSTRLFSLLAPSDFWFPALPVRVCSLHHNNYSSNGDCCRHPH